MSSRSLGELLLRPASLTRTPLRQTSCIRRTGPSWTAQRSISNTPNQPAETLQGQGNEEGNASQEPETQRPPFQVRRRDSTPNDASRAIDSLFSGMPREGRAPLFPTRTQTSSSDEMRAARSSHAFGAGFSKPQPGRRTGAPLRLNFDDMALPTDLFDPNLPNKPTEAANLAAQQEEAFANYPRLNPTYGRVVELDPSRGRDLVRGISMLGSLMARNKIRQEVMKQRFHERGGLKRKRLNSERWRARFKKGFTHITARVSELTGKGW
ncbi:hypothetical protein GQ44DRAFT_723890 [Phaeosphaeriaceae sp. PMI808]|nr:hypothetical protein GQ44DRAFT_723890 [Phaeosphaeriaceae sp. PMI808]